MTKNILFLLILIIAILPAKQLSLDIKFNTSALKKETEKSSKSKIKLTGETEFEYYDQLLKQSMKTRVWTTYDTGKETINLYINDRLQGVSYTLLLELDKKQTTVLRNTLLDYLNEMELSSAVNFQKVKMFFKYKNDWYQKVDNQFVLNLNDQDNQLQLITNKMIGEINKIDDDGKPYLVEYNYDPSFFYINTNAARELYEMISTKNILIDKQH